MTDRDPGARVDDLVADAVDALLADVDAVDAAEGVTAAVNAGVNALDDDAAPAVVDAAAAAADADASAAADAADVAEDAVDADAASADADAVAADADAAAVDAVAVDVDADVVDVDADAVDVDAASSMRIASAHADRCSLPGSSSSLLPCEFLPLWRLPLLLLLLPAGTAAVVAAAAASAPAFASAALDSAANSASYSAGGIPLSAAARRIACRRSALCATAGSRPIVLLMICLSSLSLLSSPISRISLCSTAGEKSRLSSLLSLFVNTSPLLRNSPSLTE